MVPTSCFDKLSMSGYGYSSNEYYPIAGIIIKEN
jgi:hypothetical protein